MDFSRPGHPSQSRGIWEALPCHRYHIWRTHHYTLKARSWSNDRRDDNACTYSSAPSRVQTTSCPVTCTGEPGETLHNLLLGETLVGFLPQSPASLSASVFSPVTASIQVDGQLGGQLGSGTEFSPNRLSQLYSIQPALQVTA